MINAMLSRVLKSTVQALSDKGLPTGTAETVVIEVLDSEVRYQLATLENRLRCEAKRFANETFGYADEEESPAVQTDGYVPKTLRRGVSPHYTE